MKSVPPDWVLPLRLQNKRALLPMQKQLEILNSFVLLEMKSALWVYLVTLLAYCLSLWKEGSPYRIHKPSPLKFPFHMTLTTLSGIHILSHQVGLGQLTTISIQGAYNQVPNYVQFLGRLISYLLPAFKYWHGCIFGFFTSGSSGPPFISRHEELFMNWTTVHQAQHCLLCLLVVLQDLK